MSSPTKVLFVLAGFLATPCFADDISGFLAKPTRPEARKIAKNGNSLDAVMAAYPAVKEQDARKLVLMMIVAHPSSTERTDFLSKVKGDSKATPAERNIAEFADIIHSPNDHALQNAFLAKGWESRDFDFSFYGDRGLAALESLSARLSTPGEMNKDSVAFLAYCLKKSFSSEANDILIPHVDALFNQISADSTDELLSDVFGKYHGLSKQIDSDSWRTSFIKQLIADPRLTSFTPEGGAIRDLIVLTIEEFRGKFPSDLATAIFKAYLTKPMLTPVEAETTQSWAHRRQVLLEFFECVGATFRSVDNKHAFDSVIENSAQSLLSTGVAEFTVCIHQALIRMENPSATVVALLQSPSDDLKASGMSIVRTMAKSSEHRGKAIEMRHVVEAVLDETPAHSPTSSRIEALATLREVMAYVGSSRSIDFDRELLRGLQASDEQTRRLTLSLIEEANLDSGALVKSLERLIESDPSIEVKAKALEFVTSRLKSEVREIGRSNKWSSSLKLGLVLFGAFEKGDESIKKAASDAIREYYHKSAHNFDLYKKLSSAKLSADGRMLALQMLEYATDQCGAELVTLAPHYALEHLNHPGRTPQHLLETYQTAICNGIDGLFAIKFEDDARPTITRKKALLIRERASTFTLIIKEAKRLSESGDAKTKEHANECLNVLRDALK